MDNQHKLIKGYRDLSQQEIDLINEGKALAEQVGKWITKLNTLQVEVSREDGGPTYVEETDARWVNIGTTHLQQGFMAAIRGIAKPTTF